jgi:hypothetical protein
MPVDAAVVAADRVLSLRGPMRLWDPPRGVRLVATDADWAYGDGAEKEAPIQSHLLTLTGRSGLLGRASHHNPVPAGLPSDYVPHDARHARDERR